MIVHWPAKVKPGKTEHISAFWDFMPTFSELINAAPVNSDGISFAPTLLGSQDLQRKHTYLYWEFHEQNGKQAVRKGSWKAVRLNANAEGSSIELYDLENDPAEKNNVASKFPEISAQLSSIIEKAHVPSQAFALPLDSN